MHLDLKGFVSFGLGSVSRDFALGRGILQGDPLSPLLFGLVMKQVLENVDGRWQRRKYGTPVGEELQGRRLTHVAFVVPGPLVCRAS